MQKSGESTYKIICELQKTKGLLLRSVRSGIISPTIIEHKKIYDTYLSYRKDHGKMLSYEFTATDYNLHLNTIRDIVRKMEL